MGKSTDMRERFVQVIVERNTFGCGITPETNNGRECQACQSRAEELADDLIGVMETEGLAL